MLVRTHSYRYAQEILQHQNYSEAWDEIMEVVRTAPLFIYPGKSKNNGRLDVVQQVMNTYFDRRFAVDLGWDYHPLATGIENSGLAADFRKSFRNNLKIQVEVQLGNMSRWYSDVFKFQTAYSQGLIQLGLSIVPLSSLSTRIDSNIVNYERAVRELPAAELSITLPILLVGISADQETPEIDLRQCQFADLKEITGQRKSANRFAIVNGFLTGDP